RAPHRSSVQALTAPPKKPPARRSGMARSASLALTPAALSSNRSMARAIGLRCFMDTPLFLVAGRTNAGRPLLRYEAGPRKDGGLACRRGLLEDEKAAVHGGGLDVPCAGWE